ncbi:MAG: helix-turn-helix transcriptional regulator [Hespellia sp.]|nr:helix-turn-helix transcriptional regulator [Hespellia sp.]
MQKLDNEKCGAFIALRRKEKGMTQKELAQKLMLSDKAVSKWECGLSMPDVSLLVPLSELLDVTTTELLCGEQMTMKTMDIREVETLVSGTIGLSDQEELGRKQRHKKHNIALFFACLLAVGLECLLLLKLDYTVNQLSLNIGTVELLSLIFGAWFGIFAKDKLPDYYDANKISSYSDGIFRMHIPGVHFNNSNWPHILSLGRIWMLATAVGFPLFYLLVNQISVSIWEMIRLPLQLFTFLGLAVALIIVGRKYV